MEKQTEQRLALSSVTDALSLFGRNDAHLRLVETAFPVSVLARGDEVVISGPPEPVAQVAALFQQLLGLIKAGSPLGEREFRYALRVAKGEAEVGLEKLGEIFGEIITITQRGKQIRAKTAGQKAYVEAIRRDNLVFGIGPAGTGKTYLAMALAVAAYKNREVSRIILTRPAVEAGEKLGFLPGDLQEKVDPYLRPVYDALYDIMGLETAERLMEKGVIEVAPLAYMRGRTLDDSFIVLDEAQNTTPEQMKMFLTRLGFGSRAVVTGDITQVDLPSGSPSGLAQVREVLGGVEGISFIYLQESDVVRHELVQRIIKAYEKHEQIQVK